jgi:hypothetical protein
MKILANCYQITRSITLFFFTLGIASCDGVKFLSIAPNLDLPKAYTSRSIYESGVAAYEFNDLVGNILKIKTDNSHSPLRVGIIRTKDSDTSVHIIGEAASLNFYHSFITKGGELKGNYLAFAGGFSKDQMAEYTLFDLAYASILFSQESFDVLTKALKAWVKDHPKSDSSKRIWIKSVVLTSGLYTAGNKIKANASGVLGSTVGVNGSVYNTNTQTIKNTIIGFDYFDIDEFVGSLNANAISGGMEDQKIKALLMRQPLLTIKGPLRIEN